MKKLFSILLALAMTVSLTVPAFADEPDYTTGTPWPCIDLDGVVTEETTAELKDNFALAVNKDKILALEIPEGYSRAGTSVDLAIQAAEDLKNMFLGDAPEGHDARLAYDYFQLLMDWDSRNAVGVAPLKAQTEQVEAIGSIEELSAYLSATPPEDQLSAVWMCDSGEDLMDSNHRIMIVADAELLLGDSAEYAALTPYGEIGKQAITELAEKMLLKLGYSEDEAAQKIDNCFAFETMLAPAIYTSEEQQRPDYYGRILNYVGLDDLKQMQGSLPVLESFANMGYPEAEAYLVLNPAGLEKLSALYTEENLPLLKDYIIVHGVFSAAENLDRECYEWRNAFRNAVIGATGMLDDATVFSSEVSEKLKWPTAEMYTATYLKQEDKDRIAAMIDEIMEAYHGIIEEADFLSDETRAKAIEKLDSITPNVLYPDSWEKYSCEELNFAGPEDGGTLWEANRRIARYMRDESVKEYSEPVDKEEWGDTPQTVNCFYNPLNNSLYILGAYAQGGMYNSEMRDEELLAKLGTVIGHEVSHAFDSKGAQFDKDGNMANWWTVEDQAAFLERNQKMVDYYNAMHPWEGQDFYGSIMTGEAGADMAGVKVVLRIAAGMEDFDYDAFFRAYADKWLGKDTLQMAYIRINDVHPMLYLRTNCTLQQFDEFLDFYGITEGDGMYLAPADRVIIW